MPAVDSSRQRLLLFGAIAASALGVGMARANFLFSAPEQLPATINSTAGEGGPSISGDGLALYFSTNRHSGTMDFDIYVSTRASRDEPWGQAHAVGWPVNTSATESAPCISADGLSLLFDEAVSPFTPIRRPNGYGSDDIWIATRETPDSPWNEPVNMGPRINSSYSEASPNISRDGLSFVFQSDRPGGSGGIDLWMSVRAPRESEWDEPVNLGPLVNSEQSDGTPSLSADGLHLFFHSNRPPSQAAHQVDLYWTSRRTTSEPWRAPVRLPSPVNTSGSWECFPCLSEGATTLYFVADNWSGPFSYYDIWETSLICIVDFNGDGKVDGFELLAIANYWGQGESLYDIGPTPLGDGIVDLHDVTALAQYIGKDFVDPTLVAHWAMDETAGDTASESAGGTDGTLTGDPVWRPDGGMVNGALEFDGLDDGVVVDKRVVNPSNGPFSVFAWIKGGAPGQVLIAQVNGTNWLRADASQGTLMTQLSPPAGRNAAPPLISDSLITDDNWHRVGFVWDGMTRALYVDDVLVAEDTATNLQNCSGGLHFGCGTDMAPGSFWSGLIDDVRIYNRAVSP